MTVYHGTPVPYARGAVPTAIYSRAGVVWCALTRPGARPYQHAGNPTRGLPSAGTGYLWRGSVAPHAIVQAVAVTGTDYTGAALEAIRAGAQVAVLWDYGLAAVADGAPLKWQLVSP